MARDEVPDTTVFIQLMRDPRRLQALHRSIVSGRMWLSSVVVSELYSGTRSREDAAQVNEVVDAMRDVGRIIVPSEEDWARAGRMINRRIRLHGDLRPRDHLADVLIVLSAARLNGTVLTANVRHMTTWAEIARDAGGDVEVLDF